MRQPGKDDRLPPQTPPRRATTPTDVTSDDAPAGTPIDATSVTRHRQRLSRVKATPAEGVPQLATDPPRFDMRIARLPDSGW
jgi:hypothetical protein